MPRIVKARPFAIQERIEFPENVVAWVDIEVNGTEIKDTAAAYRYIRDHVINKDRDLERHFRIVQIGKETTATVTTEMVVKLT